MSKIKAKPPKNSLERIIPMLNPENEVFVTP